MGFSGGFSFTISMLIFFNLFAQQPLPRRKIEHRHHQINAWKVNEIIRFTFDELRFLRGWLWGSILNHF